ncbi:hypothetical protein BDV12DRAFT_190400 [Aspergillus spectabilis]
MALSAMYRQAPVFRNTSLLPVSPPPPARLIEAAEASFLRSQVQTASRLFPDNGFTAIPLGNGIAGTTKRSFDWKLNRVSGLGMDGPVSETDIDRIERFYGRLNIQPYIDVCPFAHSSTMDVLRARGYSSCGGLNVHTLPLMEYEVGDEQTEDIDITRVFGEEDKTQFVNSSIEGFESGGRDLELRRTLAHTATLQPEARVYLAEINGQVAGGAGMAFLSTRFGRVAELYISSTVPKFRGKGVQTALLRKRLAEAKNSGIGIAVVNTWPGSASVRNVDRVGFKLVYTRGIFTRPLG